MDVVTQTIAVAEKTAVPVPGVNEAKTTELEEGPFTGESSEDISNSW